MTKRVPSTEDAGRSVELWRETANVLAAKEASYAYQVYARFKTFSIIDTLIGLILISARLIKLRLFAQVLPTRF